MDRKTHVKQDEWRYTASSARSRAKIKRARQKAKRVLVKKQLKEAL